MIRRSSCIFRAVRLNRSEFEDYRVLKGSKKEFHDIGSQVYSANNENRESLRKFLRTTNSFKFVCCMVVAQTTQESEPCFSA